MHLTPEQIDRQPFRMTRRGYDIVEVRDFLREIATEMRERRDVRSRLEAEQQSAGVVDQETLARVEQETRDSVEQETRERVEQEAEERSNEILAQARLEADDLLEAAEDRARERSDVVLTEAQRRLDVLILEEKELRERISQQTEFQRSRAANEQRAAITDEPVAPPTSSLADFMKSTLRQEVTPE